ncbi:MAG: hypothetical protein ACLFU0_07430 [Alphaproteobacteria bacterium]
MSEVAEKLRAVGDGFRTRDLGEHRIVHVFVHFFVDGIARRLRAGRPREAIPCRSPRTAHPA